MSTVPVLRSVWTDCAVDPSGRTSRRETRRACLAATSRYAGSPLTSDAQYSSGRFIRLSMIVSASSGDGLVVLVGIVPVPGLVAARVSSRCDARIALSLSTTQAGADHGGEPAHPARRAATEAFS